MQTLTAIHSPKLQNWLSKNRTLLFFGLFVITFGNFSALTIWTCPIYKFFGVYCPGCGATRAFGDLLRLDIQGAMHQNALLLTLPLLIPISSLISRRSTFWNRVYIVFLGAGTCIFLVARNLPNSGLAPY